jgi:RND family efflux transporter MFP subunit
MPCFPFDPIFFPGRITLPITRMKRMNPLLAGLALVTGLCLPVRAETFTATGITEPINDVLLSSSVPGLVSAWKVKEGDFVKADEVIIELDNRMEELDAERRKLAMENSKVGWESLQTLVKQSSISVKKEELLKAETEYKIATVEWQMAVEQLRRRHITSSCAGYIADIARDVGEACEAYQPLIRVVDTRQCYFVSNIEAKAAGRLKLDQSVKLEIDTAAAPVSLSGKITFLSPVVDPASGLQKVRILFDNADGRVRPGVAGKMILE